MTKEKQKNELEQEEFGIEFSPEELEIKEVKEEKEQKKEQQFNNKEKK